MLSSIYERAVDESKNYENACVNDLDNSFCVLKIKNGQALLLKEPALDFCKLRVGIVVQFFQQVANLIKDFANDIIVGLLDSYDDARYKGIFVFSRKKDIKGQVLLPDLYAMNGYNKILEKIDCLSFHEKINKAIFSGADTGDFRPEHNRRLKLCEWAESQENVLSNISWNVQIPILSITTVYPNAQAFLGGNVSIEEQRKYKFLICMDGNSCAWDRLVWQLASNSITLKEKSDNINWYYPLLTSGKEYVEFDDFNTILSIIGDSKIRFDNIIENANRFVSDYLTLDKHILYTSYLLANIQNSFSQEIV